MEKYKLVKNSEEYWEFIRKLRNLDSVKKGFIKQENISKKKQQQYMKEYGDNFWICLEGHEPVGYVGIIDDDIRVATHPKHQKKGIGTFMINEIMKKYPTAYAKIKIENEASIKLFERCGFAKKYYLLER
jgi:RimJ/RimL family protein N-acetyltransferase